jgi:hypothetical protein
MSREVAGEGTGFVPLPGDCVVTERRGALSAYRPAQASRVPDEFELPLQIYIVETVEREARSKQLRELGIVVALLVGIFATQWPALLRSASAVPNLPVSAQEAGVRAVDAFAERLTFGAGLQASF